MDLDRLFGYFLLIVFEQVPFPIWKFWTIYGKMPYLSTEKTFKHQKFVLVLIFYLVLDLMIQANRLWIIFGTIQKHIFIHNKNFCEISRLRCACPTLRREKGNFTKIIVFDQVYQVRESLPMNQSYSTLHYIVKRIVIFIAFYENVVICCEKLKACVESQIADKLNIKLLKNRYCLQDFSIHAHSNLFLQFFIKKLQNFLLLNFMQFFRLKYVL